MMRAAFLAASLLVLALLSGVNAQTVTPGGPPFCSTGQVAALDARCFGVVGDGSTDDAGKLQTAINNTIEKGIGLVTGGYTIKVSSATLTVDCGNAPNTSCGPWISYGTRIDGTSISAADVIDFQCSQSICTRLTIMGPLDIEGNSTTGNGAMTLGKSDGSDTWDIPFFENLTVHQSAAPGIACGIYRNTNFSGKWICDGATSSNASNIGYNIVGMINGDLTGDGKAAGGSGMKLVPTGVSGLNVTGNRFKVSISVANKGINIAGAATDNIFDSPVFTSVTTDLVSTSGSNNIAIAPFDSTGTLTTSGTNITIYGTGATAANGLGQFELPDQKNILSSANLHAITCGASNIGARAWVSDATTVTYHGTIPSSDTGANTALAMCAQVTNGPTYAWVYGG